MENHELVRSFAQAYPQKVILLNEENKYQDIQSVTLNHYQATFDALNYLFNQGNHHFVYITGGNYDVKSHGYSRTKAFQDFAKQHQLSINPDWIFSQKHTAADGQEIARNLIKNSKNTLPDAIFTNSDEVAIGLIDELQKIISRSQKILQLWVMMINRLLVSRPFP